VEVLRLTLRNVGSDLDSGLDLDTSASAVPGAAG
jgi:hypothetical protein